MSSDRRRTLREQFSPLVTVELHQQNRVRVAPDAALDARTKLRRCRARARSWSDRRARQRRARVRQSPGSRSWRREIAENGKCRGLCARPSAAGRGADAGTWRACLPSRPAAAPCCARRAKRCRCCTRRRGARASDSARRSPTPRARAAARTLRTSSRYRAGAAKVLEIRRHGAEVQRFAARQHRVDRTHVVNHVAVAQRTRAAAVVAGHATERGAVSGRRVHREEQTLRLRGVG